MDTAVNEVEEVVPHRGKAGKVLDMYERRRIREGKTRRDHATGAWRQRLDNLAARGQWANEVRAKNGTVASPPMSHGKGNSSKAFKIKPGKRSKV